MMGIAVSVGKGIFAVTVAGRTSVAPKGKLCQLEAMKMTPPSIANNRQMPTRQPTTQLADLPDWGTALVMGHNVDGPEVGTETVFAARGTESFSSSARFQADKIL